jgi:predicted TIM-barrel fold metal-dependent hydrolase
LITTTFWFNDAFAQTKDSKEQGAAPNPADHWLSHPRVRLPVTKIHRARFPVIDCHTHFWVKGRHDPTLLEGYVAMMDRNNIAVSISLDGTLGAQLENHIRFLHNAHADRFVIFANIDFRGAAGEKDFVRWECNQPHFVRNTVQQLRNAREKGWISGLKFFKDFGLRYRDAQGDLIRVDDPRWDPIWEVCGELGLPVLMHTADPSAFFEAVSDTNERRRELDQHPDWSFHGEDYPSRDALLEARNRVIERHPKTHFIAAHFGNDAEDLAQLGAWLEQYPNLFIEFASRINELGRQPYTARDFFVRYQDRILFGTDGPWPEKRLHAYWRFLETKDEYFPYSDKVPPPQGDWNIYGIFLDESVLRKVYHENAAGLIPGLRERLEKFISLPTRPPKRDRGDD